MEPICKAVLNDDIDTLEDIIATRKKKVNVRDIFGFTPLHHAASIGSYRCVNCLVRNGAGINNFFQILIILKQIRYSSNK